MARYFIPFSPDDASADWGDVSELIVSSSGIATVVRRDRDAELVELLRLLHAAVEQEVAPALDALKRHADDLSARGGNASERTHILLERIAAALNDDASQLRSTGSRSPTGLLSKPEVARYVGVSERTFERTVQRDLHATRVGRRLFFDVTEIDQWLAGRRVGSSSSTSARTSTSSASRSTGSGFSEARVNAILAELSSPQRGSTPRNSKRQSTEGALPPTSGRPTSGSSRRRG